MGTLVQTLGAGVALKHKEQAFQLIAEESRKEHARLDVEIKVWQKKLELAEWKAPVLVMQKSL